MRVWPGLKTVEVIVDSKAIAQSSHETDVIKDAFWFRSPAVSLCFFGSGVCMIAFCWMGGLYNEEFVFAAN